MTGLACRNDGPLLDRHFSRRCQTPVSRVSFSAESDFTESSWFLFLVHLIFHFSIPDRQQRQGSSDHPDLPKGLSASDETASN